MSLVDTRRRVPIRLIMLAVTALLIGATLAPAALAQDDPPPTEEAATAEAANEDATPLNPTDDRRGGNRLNPFAGNSQDDDEDEGPPPLPTRPDEPAAAEAAEAEEPLSDAAAAEATDAERAAADDGDAASIRAAQQAGGEDGQVESAAGARPVAAEQAAGRGNSAPTVGGGDADAAGDGGTIIQSALISGNNRGTEVNIHDCAYGSVQIDGGEIINSTDIWLSANGGTAVSTANGGDDGIVRAGGAIASRRISAGNGGSADSGADGGSIVTGAMITGNNRGHEVNFADCPGGRGDALLIVDTGDISNTTSIDISADGGTALADASGGNQNLVTGGLRGAGAGNGGSADSRADGGTVITGAMITGNNRGNSITVGRPADDAAAGRGGGSGAAGSCAGGPVTVMIDGGDISNSTVLEISADGGVAVSDASGGNQNTGIGGGAVGNGGDADASADGGTIITNAMITGNNRGNSIAVGDVAGCAPTAPASGDATGHSTTQPGAAAPVPAAAPSQTIGGGNSRAVVVQALPNTGTGDAAGATSKTSSRLLVGVALGLLGGSFPFVCRGWTRRIPSAR